MRAYIKISKTRKFFNDYLLNLWFINLNFLHARGGMLRLSSFINRFRTSGDVRNVFTINISLKKFERD